MSTTAEARSAAARKAAETRRLRAAGATQVEGVYSCGAGVDGGELLAMAPIISMRIVRDATVAAPTRVRAPQDVARLLEERYADADREILVVVILDTKNQVLAINPTFVGSLNGAMVTMREIFKAAVMLGAASIIVAHNHPSGDPSPSPEDIAITRQIVQAGKLLEIEVLDHLIIGAVGRFASLREQGLGF